MTPEEAAKSLHEELQSKPWYFTTGVGEKENKKVLFLYVLKKEFRKTNFNITNHQGFPVHIEHIEMPVVKTT